MHPACPGAFLLFRRRDALPDTAYKYRTSACTSVHSYFHLYNRFFKNPSSGMTAGVPNQPVPADRAQPRSRPAMEVCGGAGIHMHHSVWPCFLPALSASMFVHLSSNLPRACSPLSLSHLPRQQTPRIKQTCQGCESQPQGTHKLAS